MKLRHILFLAPLLLFCCKKKDKGNETPDPSANFAYSVKYDSILSSAASSTCILSFTVKVGSGNIAENRLTCSLSGLPAAVSVSPATLTVAQLLGGVFTFNIGTIALGDYPFQLKIKSDKYGVQSHNLVLRIISPPDYAPLISGIYSSCYDYCPDSGFYNYSTQASTVPDTPFLLKISNVRNMGSSAIVRVWVSKNLVVPLQDVGGKKIWGSGTYSQDARPGHGGDYVMAIKDTLVTGTDTLACTMHIEH